MSNIKMMLRLSVVLAAVSFAVVAAEEKRMVCYYGAWSIYRPGRGKFVIDTDLDPNLCTHLVYGFSKLENNAIQSYDPWEDLTDNYGKGGYLRFVGLKKRNPKLKVLIAIGGWNEGSTKYSDMAASPMARKTFVDSIIPFLEKYKFDGLDLDWEYPTTRGGKPEDKENFSHLVKELRSALGSRYLLTAAVSPNIETVAEAYDVPLISEHLDFISVMCYDYHGAWEGHPYTGHNTPLYRGPHDEKYIPHFNVNDTLTYWLDAGLPKEKTNMGMALYGRGFTLDNPSQHGLYAPAKEGIKMGPYTRQDGTWGYNEICEVFKTEKDQWSLVIDEHIQAPYAYNGDRWIGYDDVESLYVKAKYARDLGLGGAMVWSIETDDFRGHCHNKKYPLINTIRKTMNGGGKPQIPDRPKVVPGTDDEGEEAVTPIPEYEDEDTTTHRTTRRTRPPRRTTTVAPDYEDEDVTTTKKPPRRTRPPRKTTPSTAAPDYEEEENTTTRRPTRKTRPPRKTTPAPITEEEQENVVETGPGGGPSSEDGECHMAGVQSNGKDCHSFLVCHDLGDGQYKKHVQHCAHGLVYDPVIKACNFPGSVPGCNTKRNRNEVATFFKGMSV